MKLRLRVTLIVVLTITALVGTVFAVSYRIILPTFSSLEQQELMRDLQTGLNAVQNELDEIESTGRDWAFWDDMYAFVQNHDKTFIRNNLKPPDLKTIMVNLVVILDEDNRVIFSRAIDFENQEEIRLPSDLAELLDKSTPLLRNIDVTSGVSGVVLLEEHPMLMSAWPILDSNQVMPPRGTLIFGRYIDHTQIDELSRVTSLPLELVRFDDPRLEQDTAAAYQSLLDQNTRWFVKTISEDQIVGYAIIDDIFDNPILTLRIISARPFHNQAQATLLYFLAALIFLGIIFGLATYIFINRAVLTRIERLSGEVIQIGEQKDFERRVSVNGADELAQLASQTNHMLTRLHTIKVELQERNRNLETCNRIITQMAEADSHPELMKNTLKAIIQEMDFTGGAILRVDEQNQQFIIDNEIDLSAEMRSEIDGLSFDTKPMQEVLWNAKEYWRDEADEEDMRDSHGSAGYLPIALHERVEAVLVVFQAPGLLVGDATHETLTAILHELAIEMERRQSDMTVRQLNKDLSLTMQAKDDFLATVSYELRNPLNAILGLTEAFREGLFGDLSERQSQSIATIHESIRSVMTIITNVLDLSKIQNGRLALQRDWTMVKTLCELSIHMVEVQAHNKGVRLSFTVDDPEQAIWVDQRRIRQTLIILLGNAVKYTPEGGEVSLRVHNDTHNDRILFIVRDTGIGIDIEKQPFLFKPFVHLNGGGVHSHEGVGIGLALADGLVRLHGGDITLESTLGQGCCFTISLPGNPGEAMVTMDELYLHQPPPKNN